MADTIGKVRLIFENARKTDISGLSTLRFPAYFDFTNSIYGESRNRDRGSLAANICSRTRPIRILGCERGKGRGQ